MLLLVVISFAALFYLLFVSGVFSVNSVEFSPTKFIDRGELSKAVKERNNFLDSNIITFGFFGLSGRLEKVTGVSKVQVTRVSQHKILVKIVEKAPLFVWQSGSSKFLTDDEGYAWATYIDKYSTLPVVVDTKNIPVSLGSKIVDANFLTFFKDLTSQFNTTTGTKITKLETLDINSDLKVTTAAGWYVYFDTNHKAKSQLTNLARVISQAQTKKQKLEYIDLRIENRIFYK